MSNKDKIHLASADACNGCAACSNVCPNGCIQMTEDREGFLRPMIDMSKCIRCQKCEKSCPVLNKVALSNGSPTQAYAVINYDDEVRKYSSSGGVFYALAQWIIEQGGVVFGARWNANWEVVHDYAEDMEGVKAFMQSKYVQSQVGDTYKKVKGFLEQDRWVLYSGTPCQLGGLRSFLKADYKKLIQVDLVCHGVPSPGVWRKYLKETFGAMAGIHAINHRSKEEGWTNSKISIQANNHSIQEGQHDNIFMKGFLSNVFLRPSCYNCQFKSIIRNTDITLADYWGVQQLCAEMYDNKGTSLIFTHTRKGADILFSLTNVQLKEVHDISDLIRYNSCINESIPANPNRWVFFQCIKIFPLSKLNLFLSKDSIKRRLRRFMKKKIIGCLNALRVTT